MFVNLELGFSTGVLGPPWGTQNDSLGVTSRGLCYIALPWYCKTLLTSRGPQVLTVLGRGPPAMKGWEPLT